MLVAGREISARARTKAFRIITGLLVVLAIGVPVAVALWPSEGDDLRSVTLGVSGVNDATQTAITAAATDVIEIEFVDLPADEVESAVADGTVDAAIIADTELWWNTDRDNELGAVVGQAFQQRQLITRAADLAITDSELSALLAPTTLNERFVDEPQPSDDIAIVVAFLGLMSAFVLPQLFGQLTLMSVVEEKSTHVIEVLLGHIRPRTLLIGKIVGLTALAAAQLLVVTVGLVGTLLLTNTADVPSSAWRFVPILVVSIVGGLLLYTTLFALLGSLISRQEDASQVMMPVLVPLMVGYFVGQTAVFGAADTTLIRVLTLFPLTTPMLLPVRVARDAISGWELALAIAVMVVSVAVLIRMAARVYEFALLHTGSRIGWGQLVRLVRSRTFS